MYIICTPISSFIYAICFHLEPLKFNWENPDHFAFQKVKTRSYRVKFNLKKKRSSNNPQRNVLARGGCRFEIEPSTPRRNRIAHRQKEVKVE